MAEADDETTALRLEEFLPSLFHLITSGLSQQFLERLRPFGVTVQRWRVLMVIMNKGPRNIGELVRLTLIPQSALSRLIDQMERDGLVVRRVADRDSRVVEVELTESGRQVYRQLATAAASHAATITTGFDEAETAQLHAFLHRIFANLNIKPFADEPLPAGRSQKRRPAVKRSKTTASRPAPRPHDKKARAS